MKKTPTERKPDEAPDLVANYGPIAIRAVVAGYAIRPVHNGSATVRYAPSPAGLTHQHEEA